MNITIPMWAVPFLVVAFGFALVEWLGESMGAGAATLILSVAVAVAFAAGMMVS